MHLRKGFYSPSTGEGVLTPAEIRNWMNRRRDATTAEERARKRGDLRALARAKKKTNAVYREFGHAIDRARRAKFGPAKRWPRRVRTEHSRTR